MKITSSSFILLHVLLHKVIQPIFNKPIPLSKINSNMNHIDKYTFGMIGLGTMGRNLLLNMADHGIAVAGYDKDATKAALLDKEGEGKKVKSFTEIGAFINSLQMPRSVIMLVPAGKIVDAVIDDLTPLLNKGDIIIDGGNSHFTDTNRRVEALEAKGFHFFGMGISGGEEGARRGPSMMPGGDQATYEITRPVFEAIAAKVDGVPCVTYIGPGSAGHFVKMVHNGIEYGLMQLIAETYEIMKKGLQMDNEDIGRVFTRWNEGRLQSFLLDISKDIFAYKSPGEDHILLDDIKDEARAKGTGKWTSQVSMDLEVPLQIIDTSVSIRDLSKLKSLRTETASLYHGHTLLKGDKDEVLTQLEQAFYFSMIITYSQGMHLLAKASKDYAYNLNIGDIAKIWRGGCIIRSLFLNDMYNAYQYNENLQHLVLDSNIQSLINQSLPGARAIISKSIEAGIAVSCYASAITYFDTLRSERMPSNLTQAQRDYFGAHTYELIGKDGVFHTEWRPEQ